MITSNLSVLSSIKMQLQTLLALLVPTTGALAAFTCARAPTQVSTSTTISGPCLYGDSTRCVRGSVGIWFSPPNGNKGGVLRIRNDEHGVRKVVAVVGDKGTASFWINGGDECVTNLKMNSVDKYFIFRNV
ncbi:uncharacterized protein CTRU02_208267 [Colletotrichum truncatum]|uniref:Uncharacterized protein n=1 Tax=Colletotrichum truncatum TaxID=5467 RepID=A0ACC3YW86_COLTU|nr:uncharacterized protein CTRU02_07554 [Colletotrichum truncatum]KAF6791214.1 hypothetical protein CTRU02_07554 [Colletotrichum truncatum]